MPTNRGQTILSRVLAAGVDAMAARAFAWSVSGDLATRLAVAVTTLIAVRALDPRDFGRFVGFSATALLAAAFWDAGVSTLLTREFAAGRTNTNQTISQVAGLRIRALPIWIAVFSIGALSLDRHGEWPMIAVIGFAGASLATATSAVPLAMLRGRMAFRQASLAVASGRWFTAMASILALPAVAHLDAPQALGLAFLAGELITLMIAALGLRSAKFAAGHATCDTRLKFKAALPFAANGLIGLAYNRFDVVLLGALSNVRQLSLYAPASRIQDALYMLPSSLAAVALPLASAAWMKPTRSEEVRRLASKLIVGGLLLSLPPAALIFAFAKPIIAVALGPAYSGAETATRILVWSLPLAAIGAPLLAVLAASGRAIDSTKAFGSALVVALILNLSLDPSWGAIGAAIAAVSRDAVNVAVAAAFVGRLGLFRTRSIPASPPGPATVLAEVDG